MVSAHGFANKIFFSSNGEECSIGWIIGLSFGNNACGALRNKPKILIIDTDRGDREIQKQISTIIAKKCSTTHEAKSTIVDNSN